MTEAHYDNKAKQAFSNALDRWLTAASTKDNAMKQLQAILLVIFVSLIMFGIAYSVDGQSIRFANVLVIASAGLCLEINLFVFIPATIAKTEKYFDPAGSITYLLVMGMALYAIGDAISLRVVFLAVMVCIWALRLGSYRPCGADKTDGKDGRFDELKKQPSTFIIPWILQALWVFLTSLAVLISWPHPTHATIVWTDIVGGACWGIGFIIEVIADSKSLLFEKTLKTRGRFVNEGLWRFSQHPNYFGEILLWTGMFVIGAGLYEGTQWLAVISPLFIYLLLTKISGINMLDERAEARWGNDSDYQHYRQTTGILIPRPPKNKKR